MASSSAATSGFRGLAFVLARHCDGVPGIAQSGLTTPNTLSTTRSVARRSSCPVGGGPRNRQRKPDVRAARIIQAATAWCFPPMGVRLLGAARLGAGDRRRHHARQGGGDRVCGQPGGPVRDKRLYHRINWRSLTAHDWMRRLDHWMIFILIAGSYTPFAVLVLRGPLAIAILVAVWGGAMLGIGFKFVWGNAPTWLRSAFYSCLGGSRWRHCRNSGQRLEFSG